MLRPKKVLFCTDFSEDSAQAFPFAASLSSGGSIDLLHVIPEADAQFWKGYIYDVGDMDNKAKRDIDEAVDRDYRPFVPVGIPFNVTMRVGDATEEILRLAKEIPADVIVLGRRETGVLGRFLNEDIAAKVARKAECPVLIIPGSYIPKLRTQE